MVRNPEAALFMILNSSALWRAGRPAFLYTCVSRKVFPLHESVVGCGCAECNSVASIIGAHTDETGTPGDLPFEMEDV